MTKKNAIMFAISDSYSFLVANVLFSLQENSSAVFSSTDFLIYHDGISQDNQKALKKISSNVYFYEIDPSLGDNFLLKKNPKKWGPFILQKLLIFELLKEGKYKKIIWMDADLYVAKSIDFIFSATYDLAFRPSIPWSLNDFEDVLGTLKNCYPGLNAGLVCFSDSLLQYKINWDDVCSVAKLILSSTAPSGGPEERIIACLAYKYKVQTLQLPLIWNMPVANAKIKDAVIQHFTGVVNRKFWENAYIYRAFPKCGLNLEKFIFLGGKNYPIIDKDKNDFFNDKYTFHFLESIEKFSKILPLINIDDSDVKFDFIFDRNHYRYNYKKLNDLVFFELSIESNKYYLVKFTIGSEKFLTKNAKNKMEQVYTVTKELFNDTYFIDNGKILQVYVKLSNISMINYVFNKLIKIVKEHMEF